MLWILRGDPIAVDMLMTITSVGRYHIFVDPAGGLDVLLHQIADSFAAVEITTRRLKVSDAITDLTDVSLMPLIDLPVNASLSHSGFYSKGWWKDPFVQPFVFVEAAADIAVDYKRSNCYRRGNKQAGFVLETVPVRVSVTLQAR